MTSKIKFAPPRPLTESEDSHSLARWKTNFKQFTKKAPEYQHFLKSTTVWNANAVNYGFTANVGDVTPADLKDHIEDFLHLLNSYFFGSRHRVNPMPGFRPPLGRQSRERLSFLFL